MLATQLDYQVLWKTLKRHIYRGNNPDHPSLLELAQIKCLNSGKSSGEAPLSVDQIAGEFLRHQGYWLGIQDVIEVIEKLEREAREMGLAEEEEHERPDAQ